MLKNKEFEVMKEHDAWYSILKDTGSYDSLLSVIIMIFSTVYLLIETNTWFYVLCVLFSLSPIVLVHFKSKGRDS